MLLGRVDESPSAPVAQREPGVRGFSAQNLWRMRQFFEAYPGDNGATKKLSTLARQLPWSAHLHILSRSKRSDERKFYLRTAVQQRWPVRQLARQIDSGLFERAVLDPPKLFVRAVEVGANNLLAEPAEPAAVVRLFHRS